MYSNQQRKNLKPCLSFQRHNSKILKSALRRIRIRKHIHAHHSLYRLVSQILPLSYKIATVQEHIVQAILTTPQQAPISFNRSDIRIDPFPSHIFPQLRSLKRSIAKAKRAKQMEPIHWQSGIRPNRPFEPIFQPLQNNFFTTTPPHSHPQPPPRPRQIPTQYYLEQASFYAENFGPDPFATELEVTQQGPLNVLVHFVLTILSKLSVLCMDILAALVFGLRASGCFTAFWAFWRPIKLVCDLARNVEWEAFVAMVIADRIVRFLPEMGGEVVVDLGQRHDPVYTIFVKGGQAIGSGPVIVETF